MNNIIKKNTKIWNNIFEKKKFAPCFPTSNIQVFVKYHLPKKTKVEKIHAKVAVN